LINELTTIERYASQIQYYYTNTANNSFHGTGGVSVSFTATDPNNHSHSLSRNASYYIEKPDATLSASQTSTRLVDKDNDGVADYMELSSTTADGITFSASATAPTINGVGEVNFLQTLIEQTDRTGAGLQAQEMSSHNISVLDTQFPYGNPDYDTDPSFTGWTVGAGQTINSISSTPLATVDSPDQSFDNIVPNTNNYTTYSINDPFTMYLIYKPNGVGSIWIPLIAISWNWTVTAQWQLDTSDNTYKWMITSDTSNTEANGHAVTSLPQWTQNVNTILIAGWKNKQ
ncbi:MAG: hypothetical protein LBJ67_17435, partial [Planctomycetaceae bacterium]|nr:hypothetical protein [Planctomycetaceae bacterium]